MNNCEKIAPRFTDKEEFLKYAIEDKQQTLAFQGYGHYQCYCELYSETLEIMEDKSFCHQYHSDIVLGKVVSYCIVLLIVALNTVLELITTKFVQAIGFSHQSDIVSVVLIVVFISQFVNTGFILILADANF